MSQFPITRLRRLRQSSTLRAMLDAPMPGPEKFMWPVFVAENDALREPIASMPGQARLGIESLLHDLEPVLDSGVRSILLFGLAEEVQKDACGTHASSERGAVQRAVRRLRREFPELAIFTDVCLCAYTCHGHCGPLTDAGAVDNDAAVTRLAEIAVSHAAAGATAVAPSAMMDGQVAGIRAALDAAGFSDTLLMSYSTKFASAMYGPFRDAENSAPGQGDRQGYQGSFRDLRQALRESRLDEQEGADILMVKPALFYLDVLARLRAQTELPLAAYNVSGEYAMLIAAADRGFGDLRGMVRESIFSMSRAGADLLISYWANQYANLLA